MREPHYKNQLPRPQHTGADATGEGGERLRLPAPLEGRIQLEAAAREASNRTQRGFEGLEWTNLALAGIKDEDALRDIPVGALAQLITPKLHALISLDLFKFGLGHKKQGNHLQALFFLERASELVPGDLKTAANLSSVCSEASPDSYDRYLGNRQDRWLTRPVQGQIEFEWALARKVILRALKTACGVDEAHLFGRGEIPPFGEDRERSLALWCIDNLTRVLVQEGSFANREADHARGHDALEFAEASARSILSILGFGRRDQEFIKKLLAPSARMWIEEHPQFAKNLANALSALGSVYDITRRHLPAAEYYHLALKADQGLRFAAGRLSKILLHNPSYSVEQALRERLRESQDEPSQKPEKRTRPVSASKASANPRGWEDAIGGAALPEKLREFIGDVASEIGDRQAVSPELLKFSAEGSLLSSQSPNSLQMFTEHLERSLDSWWTRAGERAGYIALLGKLWLIEHVALKRTDGVSGDLRARLAAVAENLDEVRSALEASNDIQGDDLRHVVATFESIQEVTMNPSELS